MENYWKNCKDVTSVLAGSIREIAATQRVNLSNCTVTTVGNVCAGIHHKFLHGSGVAFCQKVQIKVAATNMLKTDDGVMEDDLSKPPDLSQPVLLEMQTIKVHGLRCNVM